MDPDVVFGVYEGLSGGVGLSEGYHAGYVLKIVVVVYLDLEPSSHKNTAQAREKKQTTIRIKMENSVANGILEKHGFDNI